VSLFWVDETRGLSISYDQLIHDLNNKVSGSAYIYEDNPYDVYTALLHSLIVGYEVTFVDGSLTASEIARLGIEVEEIGREFGTDRLHLKDVSEIISKLNEHDSNWSLSLFTSGTTGKPKKVNHRLHTLKRFVKTGEAYRDNIWALAYHPTHFAALQVFFQAFFNKNRLVYLFGADKRCISELFFQHGITNISATPTFYRSLLSYISSPIHSVHRVTFGGEKFDETLLYRIKHAFPNATVKNIYASTEAGSLFYSSDDKFKIPIEIRPFIRISESNELLVHQSLLGILESAAALENQWYATGDLVECIDQETFKFITRKTEMINVGGYKVNPYEVEREIRGIQGVQDVVVKSQKNRFTGEILVAEIIKSELVSENQIISEINFHLNLQAWMIPRMIKFVDDVAKTKSGKMVRV
jgi:acyl-coenzyme A synthetase/AMP-(fatty) acid ligase